MCQVLEIEAVESLGKECGVAFSTVVQDGDSTNLSNIYPAGSFQNRCLLFTFAGLMFRKFSILNSSENYIHH